jgi:hypothetical protein
LLRLARKSPKNRPQGDFFPANSRQTKGSHRILVRKAAPTIGIFALLMTQKSTSATGRGQVTPLQKAI